MRRPHAALRTFLAAYDPAVVRLFLVARDAVLAAAPDATELIYDAYNAVSVAFTFTDRLKEAFCHVAAYRGYVNLGFNRGATLADPERLLIGTGASIRHIRIAAASDLDRAAVGRLLHAAAAQGRRAAGEVAPGRAIVKTVYEEKRRPPPAVR